MKCFYDVSKLLSNDVEFYPDIIACYYDLIYDKIRSNLDKNFYLNEIKKCQGKILEVGVGTGRIFKDALDSGADIYGIDVSKSMIDILRNKIPEKHYNRIMLKDAADLNLDMKFDLIIAPFRMFQHLLNVEKQLKVLKNFAAHLNPFGLLIFDIFSPDFVILSRIITDEKYFEDKINDNETLISYISSKSNYASQTSQIKFKFEIAEKNLIKEWETVIRYFFRFELEHLIELSDLELINIYGDFSKGEIKDSSEDFIIYCRNNPLKKI